MKNLLLILLLTSLSALGAEEDADDSKEGRDCEVSTVANQKNGTTYIITMCSELVPVGSLVEDKKARAEPQSPTLVLDGHAEPHQSFENKVDAGKANGNGSGDTYAKPSNTMEVTIAPASIDAINAALANPKKPGTYKGRTEHQLTHTDVVWNQRPMAIAAVLSTLFIGATVCLLYWNGCQIRSANRINASLAHSGVVAARKSVAAANAARDALQEQKIANALSLRPYFEVSNPTVFTVETPVTRKNPKEIKICFEFDLKNVGKTPAIHTQEPNDGGLSILRMGEYNFESGRSEDRISDDFKIGAGAFISPQETVRRKFFVTAATHDKPHSFSGIINDEVTYIRAGAVFYFYDVYRHQTRVSVRISKNDPAGDVVPKGSLSVRITQHDRDDRKST